MAHRGDGVMAMDSIYEAAMVLRNDSAPKKRVFVAANQQVYDSAIQYREASGEDFDIVLAVSEAG